MFIRRITSSYWLFLFSDFYHIAQLSSFVVHTQDSGAQNRITGCSFIQPPSFVGYIIRLDMSLTHTIIHNPINPGILCSVQHTIIHPCLMVSSLHSIHVDHVDSKHFFFFKLIFMWWWWCRPHPVREHAQDLRPPLGARPASPPNTSSSAATPTGSVHKSQTVSIVGMSGQLKRCNESWFGSLQSGQFAAEWLAGSILCR